MSPQLLPGLLDTSTVILLGQIEDPADLPGESLVSAVTLAELSAGPHVARTGSAVVAVAPVSPVTPAPSVTSVWKMHLPGSGGGTFSRSAVLVGRMVRVGRPDQVSSRPTTAHLRAL